MFLYFSLDFHDFERPVIVGYLSLWVCLMLPCPEIPEVWQEFTEEIVGEENNFSSTLFNLVFGGQQIKLTKDRLARGKKNSFNFMCRTSQRNVIQRGSEDLGFIYHLNREWRGLEEHYWANK